MYVVQSIENVCMYILYLLCTAGDPTIVSVREHCETVLEVLLGAPLDTLDTRDIYIHSVNNY